MGSARAAMWAISGVWLGLAVLRGDSPGGSAFLVCSQVWLVGSWLVP